MAEEECAVFRFPDFSIVGSHGHIFISTGTSNGLAEQKADPAHLTLLSFLCGFQYKDSGHDSRPNLLIHCNSIVMVMEAEKVHFIMHDS